MPTYPDLTARVPKPHPDSVNSGLSVLRESTMLDFFGVPANQASTQCIPPNNPKLKTALTTAGVGPFRVTGHRVAVALLKKVFADVLASDPALHAALGSAGMLCARLQRGSTKNWSNHSWGFAIDLTIGGVLDRRGDDTVQVGLMRLYPYFHRHGWFWGVEFRTEDGMHFELAEETVRRLRTEGKL